MHLDTSINLSMLKKVISFGDILILMLLGNHDPFVNVAMILFTEKLQSLILAIVVGGSAYTLFP